MRDTARAYAEQNPIVESEYPECLICGELLNNVDGPGPSDRCNLGCNDAVIVCETRHITIDNKEEIFRHIFHRGCILEACNPNLTINRASQMGMPNEYDLVGARLRNATKCPICRNNLLYDCNTFADVDIVTPVSDE